MRQIRFHEQDDRLVRETLHYFRRQQQLAVAWFNQNPQLTPIPPAGAWIYSPFVQTGTLANSSPNVTALVTGTSMLAVGQVVSGTGIVSNPPTTIAAITGGATLTLSQNTTSSAAGSPSLTFTGIPGLASNFGNYQFYGVPAPAAAALDIPGSPWAIPEQQTINAGATFIPAPGGIAFINLGAVATTAAAIQVQLSAGTWTTIASGSTSVATYLAVPDAFDGGNVRINNLGSAALTFIIYRWRGQNPIY